MNAGLHLHRRRRKARHQRAAVLLEVILALVLLAAAAAVIGAGLGSSIDSVERQRLELHALNLATSVLSEAQLGLRTPANGPEPFEAPFDQWSWELLVAPIESELGQGTASASAASSLSLVEVVIRHDNPALVHRQTQIIKLGEPVATPSPSSSETPKTTTTTQPSINAAGSVP